MTGDELINSTNTVSLRLINQQICSPKFDSAKEIVRWMGAMQAQDYPMAKWAIGVRLPRATEEMIESAVDKGEIIRTHLLRPTWHFVSADDIHWMLELTAPQIIASMEFREKWLGITGPLVSQSNRVIEKALKRGKDLTRDEIIAELDKAGIRTDEYRSGHLLLRAELEGLICSGKTRAGKPTYALLDKRVAKKKTMSREESLKTLALRYFTSRGPATVRDFSWWSGLSMADSKCALEMVKHKFASEKADGQTVLFADSIRIPDGRSPVQMLPAFDEYLIAYKDRRAALEPGTEKKLISENGMFRPVIVIDGRVTGLWKRTIKDDMVVVEPALLRIHTRNEKKGIQAGVERLARFWGMKKVECRM